jgi:hypothetical protein
VYVVGRGLQLFGLLLLPAALIYGMTSDQPGAVGRELVMLAVGAVAFMLGTKIAAKP